MTKQTETFTTTDGRRYQVDHEWTHTADDGRTFRWAKITMDNPASGHGWAGQISGQELDALRAKIA